MVPPRYAPREQRRLLGAIAPLFRELHYPTTRLAKIIAALLAALVFSSLSLLVVGGFLLSQVLMPMQPGESMRPAAFMGNVRPLEFPLSGETHTGWFFPGLRQAPVVVICHGYKSSRVEILTLATSLQQNRYNVFAFNFAGHGESPRRLTTLGYRETQELLAALEMLSTRSDIDASRIGVWGYSLGGYAALTAAAQFPAVKAVAVDSVYPRPEALLRLELNRVGRGGIPWLSRVAGWEFRALSVFWDDQKEAAESLNALEGVPKLFIVGKDTPRLATLTQELYEQAPGEKEVEVRSRTHMASLVEEERRLYENLVVRFFLRQLPLASAGP